MAVNVEIPKDLQSRFDQVTSHDNSLSWAIFHINTAKRGIQKTTSVELLDQSDRIPAGEILDSIRKSIEGRADGANPSPQFILCNIPVKHKDMNKSHLYFISFCPDNINPLAKFTHASGLKHILDKSGLGSKVYKNKEISISSLDDLTLETIDPDSTVDDTKRE